MPAARRVPDRGSPAAPTLDGAFWIVIWLAAVLVALVGFSVLSRVAQSGGVAASSPTAANPAGFLNATIGPAQELALVDQTGAPFSIDTLLGKPALVFFGYTHCPDVCPATVGILGQVSTAYAPGLDVVFVTVDPERDTVGWLEEYVRYLPPGFSALTGTPAQVQATAHAWGVRYARVEGTDPGNYSMSHTADVYLVDARGNLRATFPFGTSESEMLATVRQVAASTPPTAAGVEASQPTALPTPDEPTQAPAATESTSVGTLGVEVVTSTVWAGGASPVILGLTPSSDGPVDRAARVMVTLTTTSGQAAGKPVAAIAVQPPGVAIVSYVATLAIPSPGWWGIAVSATSGSASWQGNASLAAMDPGETVPLGAPAPRVRTPTLSDVGGNIVRVSTDPLPDPRLSTTSTVDALDSGRPFLLVIDSARFKVTQACGKALDLAKFLVDRWPAIPFIHLEPYLYDVVTDTPTLVGSLAAPTLVPAARAWGLGGTLWNAGSMPWVYIVDRHGTVRAKYQGVVGSGDLDVILSMIEQER